MKNFFLISLLLLTSLSSISGDPYSNKEIINNITPTDMNFLFDLMRSIKGDINQLNNSIIELKKDVIAIKTDINKLNNNFGELKYEVSAAKISVDELRNEFNNKFNNLNVVEKQNNEEIIIHQEDKKHNVIYDNFDLLNKILVFGNGSGVATSPNSQPGFKPETILQYHTQLNKNTHWNSGKKDKSSIICQLIRASIVSKIYVAIRDAEFITIYGSYENREIDEEWPIILFERKETMLKGVDGFNNSRVRVYTIEDPKVPVNYVKIELENGRNVSLFWVCMEDFQPKD